jgi:hypothetical protein
MGNVTFFYEDYGSPGLNGTAYINADGITGLAGTDPGGSLNGQLEFLFNATPALTPIMWSFGAPISGGLVFQFSLFTNSGALQVFDGAFTTLDNLLGDNATAPTDVAGNGTMAILYPSGPYNTAGTLFTADPTAFGFNISQLDVDTPEPVSFVLIGTGLLGLGFARRFSRRRA